MTVPSTPEIRHQLLEAGEHERALEHHGHAYRSRLTVEQRAYWRVVLPDVLAIYAGVHHHSLRRRRFGPGEQECFERCFVNWDRCSEEELRAVQARVNELVGLYRADRELSGFGLGG
jgi:hypothetical protein